MICSTLPDVNLWLALTIRAHVHHLIASRWYQQLPRTERPAFCRVTQLGFLRLLTQEAVAGKDVCSQAQAWAVYDRLFVEGGASFRQEAWQNLEPELRRRTGGAVRGTKGWTDAYLAAFAVSSSLRLVTFDRALAQRVPQAVLLE